MRRLTVERVPNRSDVLEVTKAEIVYLKKKYPSISMGNHDENYLKNFDDDEVVGVIAGDIDNLNNRNADVWFINRDFFAKNYRIVGDATVDDGGSDE